MIKASFLCLLALSALYVEPNPLQPSDNNNETDDSEWDSEFAIEAMTALATAEQLDDPTSNPVQCLLFAGMCKRWNKRQPSNDKIQEIVFSLPPCRPIAPIDAQGKFPDGFDSFKVDGGCNPNGNIIERGCVFHPGAKACYRSTPPLNGHDQQCCYSNDAKLLVGPPGGGTLDMSTGFMHVFDDVIPYLTCCRFSNRCDLYYEKRPSDNGTRWHP